MNPMCWGRPHVDDFTSYATAFHSRGLTGSLGETAVASWNISGTTAQVWSKKISYMADMHNKYYKSKGLTYGRWAFVPQDIGENPQNAFEETSAVGALRFYGNRGDDLTLSETLSWTGGTGTIGELSISEGGLTSTTPVQDYVKMSHLYVSSGLTAVKSFLDTGATTMKGVLDERGITYPSRVSSDIETYVYGAWPFYAPFGNASGSELGGFIQSLNDPRANTYQFFDRYTLVQLWGSTGNTATAFNTSYQTTVPYNFAGPTEGSGTLVAGPTYASLIFQQRLNAINYSPGFYNFTESLRKRHLIWMMSKAFAEYKSSFPGLLVGNYEITPCCKEFPLVEGKGANALYLCDLGSTGGIDLTSGATGLFELDVGSPVCYTANPNNSGNDIPQNFIPAFGVPLLYYGLSGNTPVSFSSYGTGIWKEGDASGGYTNFLQRFAQVAGVTGISGGGIYEGFDGPNLTDLQRFVLTQAKSEVAASYNTIQKYSSLSNVKLIPWIGNVSHGYRTFMGDYSKTYGALDSDSFPFHYNLIKSCIRDYDITEFYAFDPYVQLESGNNSVYGIASLNYWQNMMETLVADSDISTDLALIPASWQYQPAFRVWYGPFQPDVSFQRGTCVFSNGNSYVWSNVPGTSFAVPEDDATNWRLIESPSNMSGVDYQGNWNLTTSYTLWQIVSYDGSYYILAADEDAGNVAPPDNYNWELFQSAVTATEEVLVWTGNWNSGATYVRGDVAYDTTKGRSYFCKAASIASFNPPSQDSSIWGVCEPYVTSGVVWIGPWASKEQFNYFDVCLYNGSYYLMNNVDGDYTGISPESDNQNWVLLISAQALIDEQNEGNGNDIPFPSYGSVISIGGKIYRNVKEYYDLFRSYFG
jgi:hypothetical protein